MSWFSLKKWGENSARKHHLGCIFFRACLQPEVAQETSMVFFPTGNSTWQGGWTGGWISVVYYGYCIWYSLVWCFWGLFPFYHGKNHGKFCKQYVWDLLTKASWAMLSICYSFHTRDKLYSTQKTRNTNEVIKEPGMVFPFPYFLMGI